jgi:hypothetical protein
LAFAGQYFPSQLSGPLSFQRGAIAEFVTDP